MTLLIDADYLLYSACCACEHDIRWDEDIHTLSLDEKEVKDLVYTKLDWMKLATDDPGDDPIMCCSDHPTFRHDLFREYKENRLGKRKPLGLRDLTKWLKKTFKHQTYPGLEGDDAMGILATNGELNRPVIVSPDKDMRTIPGLLLAKDELEIISTTEADRTWMLQTLIGDSADNYPGLKGVGPKTAEKIIGTAIDLPNMWEKVAKAYLKAGHTLSDAVLNARLSRILRHSDYNHDTGRVNLFDPISLS